MKLVYLAKGKLHVLEDGKAPTVIESKFGQAVRDRAVQSGSCEASVRF
jgi:hypothetical protein